MSADRNVDPVLTTAEQKIWNYLKEHNTPVTVGTLAKRFILSQSKTYHALNLLERNGMAVSFKIGNTKFYRMRREDE